MNYQFCPSPIGALRLLSDGDRLTGIEFDGTHRLRPGEREADDAVLSACRRQLTEYFAGQRRRFELPLAAAGTAFQQQVWQALCDIPWGRVCRYRDIATACGNARAVRAVGAAIGRNPLPIVIPCHRVIGSDGSLTGFAGGLPIKQQLLELEGLRTGLLSDQLRAC